MEKDPKFPVVYEATIDAVEADGSVACGYSFQSSSLGELLTNVFSEATFVLANGRRAQVRDVQAVCAECRGEGIVTIRYTRTRRRLTKRCPVCSGVAVVDSYSGDAELKPIQQPTERAVVSWEQTGRAYRCERCGGVVVRGFDEDAGSCFCGGVLAA